MAVEVFRMLADGTRIRILSELVEGELSVTQLAHRIGKQPASVSQHLAKLRMGRLVRAHREGTTIFYRLSNEHVARLITDALHNAEHARPGVPAHHSDQTVVGVLSPDAAGALP
jgi:DNA-binding transcriptional ArsR family regulator